MNLTKILVTQFVNHGASLMILISFVKHFGLVQYGILNQF